MRHPADPEVLNLGLPVLGICYGLQFMTHTLGGTVHAASKREYGHAEVSVLESSALFSGSAGDALRLDVARRRGGQTRARLPA